MKKYLRTVLQSIFALILVTASISCFNSLSNRIQIKNRFTSKNQIANNLFLETSTESHDISIYNDCIKTEGNIDEHLVEYLKTRLEMIPKDLLDEYFLNRGSILLTDKDISETYYNKSDIGNIVGLHDANKNIIYISNSEYAIDYALIHEFGHVLDSMTGWYSMSDKFHEIFEEEVETLDVLSVDNHYKENQREFFAEVFQELVLDSEKCKNSAPKAYNFVYNSLKNIKKGT